MNRHKGGGDETEIDRLMNDFFGLFNNKGGKAPNLERIFDLFIPQGVIVKNLDANPEILGLRDFIEPRKAILTDGTLREFEEWEEKAKTEILGNIAQRVCIYRKKGLLNEVPFETKGAKVAQFIRTPQGWRFTAVAWDDGTDASACEWSG